MELPFSKYVGCGNDFVLIDNRDNIFPATRHAVIKKICDRHHGIGADGIILVETSTTYADARMRIYNADGSEAEMCGNGIRCLSRYLKEIGLPGPSFTIQTVDRHLHVHATSENVTVEMGSPTDLNWSIPLKVESKLFVVHYLNTGVPHTIFFTDDIENFPLEKMGPVIRHHKQFAPKGTNVNIAALDKNKSKLSIRTFERGVEGETLACGTGATAAALAASKLFELPSPIAVKTKSGDYLYVSFRTDNGNYSNVTQSGPAKLIYRGFYIL